MLQLLVLLVSLSDQTNWRVTQKAIAYVGTPYRYGTASADATDCSGLVQMIFREVGVKVPRTAEEQYRATTVVDKSELEAGDLVFFANTYKKGISHVGIYVGGGRFVHAARADGVRIDHLSQPYYSKRLVSGGRARIEPRLTEPSLTLSASSVSAK
jgi:peptidoglycan DL-endopeptidase CwlO